MLQAETGHERLGEALPVHVGVGGVVGGVGARRTRELPGEAGGRGLDVAQCPTQAGGVDRHLLAEGGRGGGLAVGPGQHRQFGVLVGHRLEFVPDGPQRWDEHRLDGRLHQQPLGEVVHVLAGEAEMNPRVRGQSLGEVLAEKVLDGLDVVVGRCVLLPALRLQGLDDTRVLLVERLVQRPELGALVGRDRQRRRFEVRERQQVLDLDPDAGADERLLARVWDEWFGVSPVPPVQRRDGRESTTVCHTRSGWTRPKWVSDRPHSPVRDGPWRFRNSFALGPRASEYERSGHGQQPRAQSHKRPRPGPRRCRAVGRPHEQ